MKSWARYQKRFLSSMFSTQMSLIEKSILASLVAALLINSCFIFVGRDVGDTSQVRLAKLKAEQELMVASPAHSYHHESNQ